MLIATPSGRKLVSVSTISVHQKGEEPVVLNLLRNGFGIETTRKAAQRLTPRQIDVLQGLAAGQQVKTIAGRLGITETTTRNHVAAILRRLGCHSQLEAVAKAHRLGLIEP
jgi:DNA-binding NarL/FixJ family response regulator